MKMKKYRLIALALALCVIACAGCAQNVNYSDAENWAYYGQGQGKQASLFLVCPTVDMGRSGNFNMSMTDEKTKANFVGALNMERGIYEDSLTLYAPYYRQAAFSVYSLPESQREQYMRIAYRDVRAAFINFAAKTDGPFVLAGFSQGSEMTLRLLKEFFDDPAYSDRLIAAYCIGWRLTEDDVKTYPWLKPAQGESDTGVIVCFNTEAEGVNDSLMVPEGVKTLAINPLDWSTGSEYVPASENPGACFTDYSGSVVNEVPQLTGAYIDPLRGTLKATDIEPSDYSNPLFPDGVYHLYDYQFFFRSLQQNVAARTQAYIAAELEPAA